MGCGVAGATLWFRRLNPNVRNRLLYDFLIYAGAGMWARYGLMHDADQSGRHARIARTSDACTRASLVGESLKEYQ